VARSNSNYTVNQRQQPPLRRGLLLVSAKETFLAPKAQLPPIFEQNPDLRFVGTGVTPAGTHFLKFASTAPSGVQQVICYVHCKAEEPFVYGYTVRRGQLVESYVGPHGDPAKDTCDPLAVMTSEF